MPFRFIMIVLFTVCAALPMAMCAAEGRGEPAAPSVIVTRSQATSREGPAKVFRSVLPEVKNKTKLPVLLPSELPQPIEKARYTALDRAAASDYAISLYYELGIGDAGFAALFAGQGHANYRPEELKGIQEVKLVRGVVGFFRPISCGGSCSPVNLWWERNNVLYQVQLKLSSATREEEQAKAVIAVANSAILGGPR